MAAAAAAAAVGGSSGSGWRGLNAPTRSPKEPAKRLEMNVESFAVEVEREKDNRSRHNGTTRARLSLHVISAQVLDVLVVTSREDGHRLVRDKVHAPYGLVRSSVGTDHWADSERNKVSGPRGVLRGVRVGVAPRGSGPEGYELEWPRGESGMPMVNSPQV